VRRSTEERHLGVSPLLRERPHCRSNASIHVHTTSASISPSALNDSLYLRRVRRLSVLPLCACGLLQPQELHHPRVVLQPGVLPRPSCGLAAYLGASTWRACAPLSVLCWLEAVRHIAKRVAERSVRVASSVKQVVFEKLHVPV
jgi:hypothetical protein